MQWTVPSFFLFTGIFVDSAHANKQCRRERSINGMALQGFVFKRFSVRAFHECDISCEREPICQSYNYVVGENSCELNNRTKEARPAHFRSDPARVYLRRLSNRAPLGSIPELPAHSCQEIKASEGESIISNKYWLDPTGNGTSVLVFCDMNLEDIDECATGNHDCDVNANCTNTVGGHNCTCKQGFAGDGRSCSVCGAVGVEDRNKTVDARMTASTSFSSYYHSYYGRLNENRGKGAWCPKTKTDRTDYLQVEMVAVHSVCAVATQGHPTNVFWVTSYKVHLSTDGVTWNSYKENNVEKEFAGNTDRSSIVKHSLSPDVKARFVRFYPVTHHRYPCLRVEIFVLK